MLARRLSLASRAVRSRTGLPAQTVEALTGTPREQLKRRVLVQSPTRTAMQSATGKANKWRVKFGEDVRWRNPLMGWASNADPMSNLRLEFATREEAVEYCRRNSLDYVLEDKHVQAKKAKQYGEHFMFHAPKPGQRAPVVGGSGSGGRTENVDDYE